MRTGWLFGALMLVLASCDMAPEPELGVPDGTEAAQKYEGVKNPAILPAYKLPSEVRIPGKQDAATDYRKAHPQWYAITEAPPASFRAMKEWEPMVANIITYSNYLPSDKPVAQTMADIAIESVKIGELWVVVTGAPAKADLIDRMTKGGVSQADMDAKVKFFNIDNDAIWTIDFGPLPMVDDKAGDMIFQDFRYYHPRYHDDGVPTRLGNAIGVTTYRSPFDFEGGNFQSDGEEYCYTTERLYLYTGMNYDQVNEVFKTYYGCKKAVVLKDITNDGTGHVDMFFKLGGKNVAFMGEYTTVVDATNKKRMDDNVKQLEALTYSSGGPGITVYRIPMPHAGKSGGESIPRTFINSTLFSSADGSKKVNLWPIYTVDKDLEAEALASWEAGMPDWDHVGIISDQVSLYSGAIHCVTRTVPAIAMKKYIPDGTCEGGACTGGGSHGYDGACVAGAEPDPGCWGPKWQCLCNYCEDAGCGIPESCGDGTCGDKETCFNCAMDCACGADKACSPVTQQCASDTCGNGKCDNGENCVTCAADCGCKTGESCAFGICTADPCGGIEYEGCCDGATLAYCDGGELATVNCGADGCGWVAGQNWYDCGGDGEDPAGTFKLDCGGNYDYPPGCAGKECGDNGGGYSCGECPEGTDCVNGKCGECDPAANCAGKECGDDGCGGQCGTCAEGSECKEGKCEAGPCDPVANCTGKECGDDGCGGQCGTCGEGLECSAEFKCVEVVTPPVEGETDIQGEDVGSTEDIAAGEGTSEDTGTTTPPKKKDDGCTASGQGNPLAGLLLAGALLALVALRRRVIA